MKKVLLSESSSCWEGIPLTFNNNKIFSLAFYCYYRLFPPLKLITFCVTLCFYTRSSRVTSHYIHLTDLIWKCIQPHSAWTYRFICCVFFLLMTFHSIKKHKKLETWSRKNARLYNTKGLLHLNRKWLVVTKFVLFLTRLLGSVSNITDILLID